MTQVPETGARKMKLIYDASFWSVCHMGLNEVSVYGLSRVPPSTLNGANLSRTDACAVYKGKIPLF